MGIEILWEGIFGRKFLRSTTNSGYGMLFKSNNVRNSLREYQRKKKQATYLLKIFQKGCRGTLYDRYSPRTFIDVLKQSQI